MNTQHKGMTMQTRSGIVSHVLADPNMSQETELAIEKMINLAYNMEIQPAENFVEIPPERINIFSNVNDERLRQEAKWGVQNHDLATWCLILGEEVGEVQKVVLEHLTQGKDISNFRTELIQVAAVAFQIIEWFDKKNNE